MLIDSKISSNNIINPLLDSGLNNSIAPNKSDYSFHIPNSDNSVVIYKPRGNIELLGVYHSPIQNNDGKLPAFFFPKFDSTV